MKFNIAQESGFHIDVALDEVIPAALDAAMPALVSATKSAVQSVIRHPDESTGALVASVTATKTREVKGGGYYAAITFPGTDANGIRNGLKAAELEYGNSYQPSTPFQDRSISQAMDKVVGTFEDYLAKELNK